MKAFEAFPPYTNMFDVPNDVWHRTEGPYVKHLFIAHHVQGLATGNVYIPKDGSQPHAMVYVTVGRRTHDSRNPGNGLTVEELMAWVERELEIVSHELP